MGLIKKILKITNLTADKTLKKLSEEKELKTSLNKQHVLNSFSKSNERIDAIRSSIQNIKQ